MGFINTFSGVSIKNAAIIELLTINYSGLYLGNMY